MPEKTMQQLSYEIYNVKGEKTSRGHLVLPLVDVSKYKKLIAQSVRVFLANQRQGNASTKSRGEVEGSTRKIYRQKGTGRARHGDIKAPIFIGGGIIFGPKPREFTLKLNKKMKRKVFLVSMIDKILNNKFKVVNGLDKLPIKTKNFQDLFQKITSVNMKKITTLKSKPPSEKIGKKILFINEGRKNLLLSIKNIPFVTSVSANTVNTYQVLTHSVVIAEKNIVNKLFKRLGIFVQTTTKRRVSKK